MEHDATDEVLPLVNETGDIIGHTTRREAHNGSMALHPVVHLHVYNSRGELYLQKRPAWKDVQPNKWDTATGGHVAYGESIAQALSREVEEEIGLTDYTPCFVARYVFESDVERELVHVFTTVCDSPIAPNANELDGGRFWSASEIGQAMGRNTFTPNFEYEYKRFLQCRQQ